MKQGRSLSRWLMGIFSAPLKQPPPPPHDPNDMRITETASAWSKELWCRSCMASQDRGQIDGDYCPHCGHYERFMRIAPKRIVRKIWDGERWVYQYRFEKKDQCIVPKRL